MKKDCKVIREPLFEIKLNSSYVIRRCKPNHMALDAINTVQCPQFPKSEHLSAVIFTLFFTFQVTG